MRPRVATALRGTLAVGAVAAVLSGAAQLPDEIAVGSTVAAAARPAPAVVPARQVLLACPGPETHGVTGVPPVGGTSTMTAVTAPQQALAVRGSEPGELALTVAGTPAGATTERGRPVTAPLAGPVVGQVVARGALAPGTAALQTFLVGDGPDRGLGATPCLTPRAEAWLLAGGSETTRRERLVVANPGANAVTVDVEVFGAKGRLPVSGGARVAVPPHGRVAMLLDGIAPQDAAPMVHVVATGGQISAVLEDGWIEGTTSRGRDDATTSEPPSTLQVVPIAVLSGAGRVRIAVPGDGEAVVQLAVLTPEGPTPLPADSVVRVPARTTRDVTLNGIPAGAYAVQVRADRPVVSAVLVERRAAGVPSDLAWIGSAAPLGALGGTPLPAGTRSTLVVTGAATSWSATVHVIGATGAPSSQRVSGAADAAVAVDLGDASAVWVAPESGQVRAGVSVEAGGSAGPLLSAWALPPAVLTTTDVPVAEVRR